MAVNPDLPHVNPSVAATNESRSEKQARPKTSQRPFARVLSSRARLSSVSGVSASRALMLVLPAALGVEVFFMGFPLWPDASYYLGGISLFPSPLGTVLGTVAGGYTGFAILNAIAAFAIILVIGLIALELGTHPLVAQLLAFLVVPVEWFMDWGMDAPGVAMLLVGGLLYLRGHTTWALVLGAAAAATHLAALPLVVGAVIAQARLRGVLISACLVGLGAVVAMRTPYRAAFGILSEPEALLEGARELAYACWPRLVLVLLVMGLDRRVWRLLGGSAVGAVVAGAIPAAVGQVGITRYAVPCLFLAVPALRLRRNAARATARTDTRGVTWVLHWVSGR